MHAGFSSDTDPTTLVAIDNPLPMHLITRANPASARCIRFAQDTISTAAFPPSTNALAKPVLSDGHGLVSTGIRPHAAGEMRAAEPGWHPAMNQDCRAITYPGQARAGGVPAPVATRLQDRRIDTVSAGTKHPDSVRWPAPGRSRK